MSGARLILLRVIEKCYNSAFLATDSPGWKVVHDSWLSDARSLLDRKEKAFRAEGCYSIKKEVRCGETAHEAVEFAVEQGASIIIARNRHDWPFKDFLGQSFSKKLVELPPCPVKLVNEPDQAARK